MNLSIKILIFVLFLSFFLRLEQTVVLAQEIQQQQVVIAIVPQASNPNTINPFSPSNIVLPHGTTVKWINYDNSLHTVTSFSNSFDSGILSQNQSFYYTFQNGGYYNYHCQLHPYMIGRVTVN